MSGIKVYAGIGSRETPQDVLARMRHYAARLGQAGWVLRSGGASGADTAFELGAGDYPKEIWLPWRGFNGNTSELKPSDAAYELAAKFHPAWGELRAGRRAEHGRNCHQVLGADLNSPVAFVVCWTINGGGDGDGGTGQAIRIAKAHEIPVFDLGTPGMTEVFESLLGQVAPYPKSSPLWGTW